MNDLTGGILFGAVMVLIPGMPGFAQDTEPLPPLGPDDLAFSIDNMQPDVEPGTDFYRYASGAWLERVVRPERLASYGIFDIMGERLKAQMKIVVENAGAHATTAAQGSPVQLVGDFYNAYMDAESRDSVGIEPLRAELDRIAAIDSLDDLVRFMGRMPRIGGPLLLVGFGPSPDFADSKRYAIYGVGSTFGLDPHFDDVFNDPPDSPRLIAYKTYLEDVLQVAGYQAADATRIAAATIEIETELHAAKLTPVEMADPGKLYNPTDVADVQAQIPEFDLAVYFDAIGYALPDRIILTQPRYLPVLAQMLRDRPLEDFKDYAALRLILEFQSVLTTAFEVPTRALNEALTGVGVLPTREERALGLMRESLGHPLSQVYVDQFFAEDTKRTALDMIERIHQVCLDRIPTRDWLSDETRAAALEKLEKFDYQVGYPEDWIDFSSVDIGPDPVVNLMNIAAFEDVRLREKYGGPVVREPFSDLVTLPITINAAYNPLINGFEVPAAMLQPPAFPAEMDAPVYFCRLGGIIGHEMTHGFDSGGRQFDGDGNLRDWWTPEDAKAFEAEAQKLIDQADGFEVLPGLMANGPLNVKENMADVGGITFAHEALLRYLAEHPEENVEIDGLTPAERCFIAWAQMWTWKATDQFTRAIVAINGHPPNQYRAVAPLQHVDAFYEGLCADLGDGLLGGDVG
jgi:putative endopeptidase